MVRKIIAQLSLASVVVLVACGGSTHETATASNAAASSLDGSSFDVVLGFPGEAPVKDKLRFDGGRFESTACTGLGFPQWTPYHQELEARAVAFATTTQHPSGTTMQWKCTVDGDTVDGTATRTMSGKTTVATVHGTRGG